MDEKQQGGANEETRQSPQAGNTPTGQAPQESGDQARTGDGSYQPGQGGVGGGGYQPGQSERAGGITSNPGQDSGRGQESGRGTDASES